MQNGILAIIVTNIISTIALKSPELVTFLSRLLYVQYVCIIYNYERCPILDVGLINHLTRYHLEYVFIIHFK